jgi:hypothetical protein
VSGGIGDDYIALGDEGKTAATVECGPGFDRVDMAGPEDFIDPDCEQVNGVGPGPTIPARDAPTAGCDVYWVRHHHTLTAPAPGVLGNDEDPNGLDLTAKILKTNFAAADHPFSFNGTTGAFTFKANSTPKGKPFVARIDYQDRNSKKRASNVASIKIYIQESKPPQPVLDACDNENGTTRKTQGKKKAKASAKKVSGKGTYFPVVPAEGVGMVPFKEFVRAAMTPIKGKDEASLTGRLSIGAGEIHAKKAEAFLLARVKTTEKREITIGIRPDDSKKDDVDEYALTNGAGDHIDLGHGEKITELRITTRLEAEETVGAPFSHLNCSFETGKCHE